MLGPRAACLVWLWQGGPMDACAGHAWRMGLPRLVCICCKHYDGRGSLSVPLWPNGHKSEG
ncbi:hypothetical protein CBI36_03440 [Acetobacter oryzifermentans]|uniref:Uncharacterized protein n=2 Tax=Acetobacter TaxID=434 RepID=A0AAN1PIW0_9PROT|nr:hypothetical protein WG31_03560 [Acetobacter oryzifermentans]ASL39592.1 hypothetical protein CBI36_03440 [Acetobacter oryzifermentans]ATI11772.1 hypothetical protein CPF11_04415 [Acetobacter pomorum]AXC25854.1 hypothetical protein DS739_03015 [Acetobacter sp. JWB]AXN00980.1 hypothetical protein CJF59_10770 [Acetobacter pomorum]